MMLLLLTCYFLFDLHYKYKLFPIGQDNKNWLGIIFFFDVVKSDVNIYTQPTLIL